MGRVQLAELEREFTGLGDEVARRVSRLALGESESAHVQAAIRARLEQARQYGLHWLQRVSAESDGNAVAAHVAARLEAEPISAEPAAPG